jgi:LDH2 family malate/lactate/ureidoglycolate dehydrogenase
MVVASRQGSSMHVGADRIREQLMLVFGAWGMSQAHAATTAEAMVETDLRGIDSHGIAMLPSYDEQFRAGRLNMRPDIRVVRDTPVTAVIDADASMGHVPSVQAMTSAVDKCLASGIALVSVVNSHHFGAAGCYTRIAADRGVIGLAATTARGILMVPTFAAEPVLGTNPLAFAAPAARNAPFELDMATTTVAGGKINVHRLNHKPIPAGWVIDGEGNAVVDADEAYSYLYKRPEGGLTPLGGSRELGSHKGYGLAMMVQILAGTLAGAAFSPLYTPTQGPSEPHRIGHVFLAIDPDAFRPAGAFEDDLDAMIDLLHRSRPADPGQPVLVAGDPEMAARRQRLESGIPIPDDLLAQVRAVAEGAGARFVLVT